MALKKPSDLFTKKEISGVFSSPEISTEITETYDRFRDNFDKVNNLSEKVEQLSQQLSEKLNKNDLENAMLSQLMVLDENFKSLQNQVRGLNKEDLREFRTKVSSLTEIVEELVEKELPKYKKQITKNEVRLGEKFDSFKEIIEENILEIRGEVDDKSNNIAEVIDNNLEYFNNQLQDTSLEVKKTVDTYNKLSKILETKIIKENQKLEEYSKTIESLHESFLDLQNFLNEETSSHAHNIDEKFENISSEIESKINLIGDKIKSKINLLDEEVFEIKDKFSSEITNIKADVVINEQHLKKVENYIQENHQEIVTLREEVFAEIGQLSSENLQENLNRLEKKIDFIRETYSKIEPEVIVNEVIQESLLKEPSKTKNKDPLTPLDQNFVTLSQLQEHYRLFINRIQQQLSTLGGGGETQLKYLDDIIGIATNASAYDGKYLKYDHTSGKFVFESVDITNDSWSDGVSGPYTYGNVGIGTSLATSSLHVIGDIIVGSSNTTGITSIISATGDVASWEYNNASFSVATQETGNQDIFFKSDGTKMFIIGSGNDRVYEYSLSTPWEVTTAGFTTFFSVATQDTVPLGLFFSPTGDKMFVSGQTGQTTGGLISGGDYIHQYALGTNWDISNQGAATVGWTTSYRVLEDTAPQGVFIGAAGTAMYVVGSTNDRIYQYTLGTAYSLSGTVSIASTFNPVIFGAANETSMTGIDFNSDGTIMWTCGSNLNRIFEYRLSTPWDITTAKFYQTLEITSIDGTPVGICVNLNQNKAYVLGDSNDRVFQFDTNIPAIKLQSSGITTSGSIILQNEVRMQNDLFVSDSVSIGNDLTVYDDLTILGGALNTGNIAITFSDNTTSAVTLAGSLTSSTVTIGGTLQTGSMILGRSSSSHTLDIDSVSPTGTNQKTINIGAGGTSGTRTFISLGANNAGAISTVFLPSPTNLGIGISTPTSRLHVAGDTLVTGVVTATTFFGNIVGVAATFTGSVSIAGTLTYEDVVNVDSIGVITARNGIVITNGGLQVNSGVSTLGVTTFTGAVSFGTSAYFGDNDKLYFGDGNDLEIYHDGSNSVIKDAGTGILVLGGTGAVQITNAGLNENLARFLADGAAELYYDNVKTFETTGYGATVFGTLQAQGLQVSGASTLGITTFTGAVSFGTSAYFGDNDKLYFGDGNDLEIYSDGDNSFIKEVSSTGSLYIDATNLVIRDQSGAETGAIFTPNGSVSLYYDNVKEFETTGYGATVFGILQAQGLQVSGVSTVGFLTATNIWNAGITTSSRLTLNGANDTATGGGQIYLNGATGNRIDFNTNGVAAPAFTTRSVGTKLVLYPVLGASSGDYAIGIENGALWHSLPGTSQQFRWYGGTTQLADLKGTGELVIGSTSLTGTTSQRLQVTGGAYVSGSVGIGTTNPSDKLHVLGNTIRVDSATGALNFWNGSGWYGGIGVAGGLGGSGTDIAIRAEPTRGIIFFTGGANDRGRIDASGTFLVGAATSTGTASQLLQVTGGAYVSGNVGVGTTNPLSKLHVEQTTEGEIARFRASDSTRYLTIKSFNSGFNGSGIEFDATSSAGALRFSTNSIEKVRITTDGNVGVGTTNPGYKLEVLGSFAATTKSFVIDHPTKPGMKLRYASLEGPENGIYIRGRTQSSIIELPEYWTGLVDETSITVNLTPIGRKAPLHSVVEISNNTVEIESANDVIDCFYTVFAERKDVEKLEVEI